MLVHEAADLAATTQSFALKLLCIRCNINASAAASELFAASLESNDSIKLFLEFECFIIINFYDYCCAYETYQFMRGDELTL